MKKRTFLVTALAVAVGITAGCSFFGGNVDEDSLANILNDKVSGVVDVKVANGYDGLTPTTDISIYVADDVLTADQVRSVFTTLADDVQLPKKGIIGVGFLGEHSGVRVDASAAVTTVVQEQGEPTGDYLPVAMENLKESAGLSISNHDRFKQIADYLRS